MRGVLKPLARDGYEDLTFLHHEQPVTRIEKDEAANIRSAPPLTPEEEQEVREGQQPGAQPGAQPTGASPRRLEADHPMA